MQLLRYYRLNRPNEHTNSRDRPNAQTSSFHGSNTFYFGCRTCRRNSGELYSTVVSSAVQPARPTSIISSKSQSRYLPLLQSMFSGLISRWASPFRCSLSSSSSISFTKLMISSLLKGFISRLRVSTYSCRFISYRCMNSSRLTLSLPSSRSRPSSFSRPAAHPVRDRSRLTPSSAANPFFSFTASSFRSTERVRSWQGTSLTTKLILVSRLMQLPTKYLLRLMSCWQSNSSRLQKLNGRTSSHNPPYIVLYHQMRLALVDSTHRELLDRIRETLLGQWLNARVDVQNASRKFDSIGEVATGEGDWLYAVLIDATGKIVLVASLFQQFKFTRDLTTAYHLEIEYKDCTAAEELFFQQKVAQLLPGYKTSALNVTPSPIFKPHQVYMELDLHRNSQLRGAL